MCGGFVVTPTAWWLCGICLVILYIPTLVCIMSRVGVSTRVSAVAMNISIIHVFVSLLIFSMAGHTSFCFILAISFLRVNP